LIPQKTLKSPVEWPTFNCNIQRTGTYPKKKPFFDLSASGLVETNKPFQLTITSIYPDYNGQVLLSTNLKSICPSSATITQGKAVLPVTIDSKGEPLFISAIDISNSKRYGISGAIAVRSDTKPPGPIEDLAVSFRDYNSIELIWTAPGDDGDVGTATYYDIRYSENLTMKANL